MNELHGCGYVHGDIKPTNMMLFENGHIWKLIDFEFSGKENEDDVIGYSARYAAPEIIQAISQGKILQLRRSMDVFSLGVVAYEFFTGMDFFLQSLLGYLLGDPYYGHKEKADIEELLRSSRDLPSLDKIHDDSLKSLLRKMLIRDHTKRITVSAALGKAVFMSPDTSSVIQMRSNTDEWISTRPNVRPCGIDQLGYSHLVVGMKISPKEEDPTTTMNDIHPSQPLFLLRNGISPWLCVRVTFISTAASFIKRVNRVTLTFPEEDEDDSIDLTLEKEQVKETKRISNTTLETSVDLGALQDKLLRFEALNKIHQIDVLIRIGSSDDDKRKGFDVLKEKLLVRYGDVPMKEGPSFRREIEVIREWNRLPHSVQDLETADLCCGMISLDLVAEEMNDRRP